MAKIIYGNEAKPSIKGIRKFYVKPAEQDIKIKDIPVVKSVSLAKKSNRKGK